MFQAYEIILSLALVAALWLNVRALPHVLVLVSCWAVSAWLNGQELYELRLLVDAIAFVGLLSSTLWNVNRRGYAVRAEVAATEMMFLVVFFNLIMWAGSFVLGRFDISQEVFSAYMTAYGWGGCLLFLGSVLALLWGANVRDRIVDVLGSADRLRVRISRLFASPKAYFRLFGVREHKT